MDGPAGLISVDASTLKRDHVSFVDKSCFLHICTNLAGCSVVTPSPALFIFHYLCVFTSPQSLCLSLGTWEAASGPMSSNTCMFELCGCSCPLQFGRGGVLHLQNERLLYSANLFPMEGPYSECRYCLLILSENIWYSKCYIVHWVWWCHYCDFFT